MGRMIHGDVTLIARARGLLYAWGLSERRELTRMSPKLAQSALMDLKAFGFDIDAVTADDLVVVGQAVLDLNEHFPAQYEVIRLFYRKNMRADDVADSLGVHRRWVYQRKELGEFFVAGRV